MKLKKEYNIFISYRGSSELSPMFAEKLYCEIMKIPNHKKVFGNVFYSRDYSFGNFKNDIPKIMKHVDFFIIPFDKNYLNGFLNAGGSPNNDSITYLEIKQALKNGCRFFVPVSLDGSKLEPIHLKSIYKKYDKIACSNQPFFIDQEQLRHNKEAAINELVYRVCGELAKLNTTKLSIKIKKHEKNIYLDFCENIKRENKYVGLVGCKAVTLVNLAGSTFIDGIEIADTYKHQDALNKWFQSNVRNGKIDFIVLLVNPDSAASVDASNYKMYPDGIRITKNEIIEKNLESVLEVKNAYRNANIRVYLTDIAIPYSIQKVEFLNVENDYFKIDMYAPLLSSDGERPTFYLAKRNAKTESLYSFFQRNMNSLIKDAREVECVSVPDNWVFTRQIVHRANYNSLYSPMSKDAINQCIKNNLPIEVDIIRIKDGEYLVARDEMIQINNQSKQLTECTRSEVESYRNKNTVSEYMFFDELVEFVHGQIPILIELKCELQLNQENRLEEQCVEGFYNIISNFNGRLEYAVISSNPYILKYLKEKDAKILCGQITLDISKKGVSQHLVDMHNDNSYIKIFDPDFIACNISDISSKRMVTYCMEHRKPLLGWCGDTEEKRVFGKCCDNLIVENIG